MLQLSKTNFNYFNEIIIFTSNISIYKNFFFIFYTFILTLTVVFLINYFTTASLLTNLIATGYNEFNLYFLFIAREVEKEFSNTDDMLLSIMLILSILSWFFFSFLGFEIISYINVVSVTIIFIFILFTIICITPFFIILDQGFFFVHYLRGSAGSTNFSFEALLDSISIIIMFLRVIVQHIRFILIIIAYTELNEFIINISVHKFFIYSEVKLYSGFYTSYYIITTLPVALISLAYYVIHGLVVLLSNVMTYLFLVFWLYIYLYSSFFGTKMEAFFK